MSNLKKNFAYQSMYQILAIILPLITSPYISRVLGAERIGIYSYTYAIAYYFMLVALLGIGNYGNKTIAASRNSKKELNTAFTELMIIHVVFAGLAVAAYYAYVIHFVQENKMFALIQGFWVLSAFFDVSWFFLGIERFKLTVLRDSVVKILMTVCIFLFVKKQDDLWLYITIMAFGTFLSQIALWPALRKHVRFTRVTAAGVARHLKPVLILFIPAVAVSLYRYMDKIMLGEMSGNIQVGFYENAERAIAIPNSLIAAFGTVMLPKMSRLVSTGKIEQRNAYLSQSMEFIICLSVALAFGLSAVAENFSVVFWGAEFADCGPLIALLSVTVVLMSYANVLRMQYLIPVGKNGTYTIAVVSGAAVNLIINMILIPIMGAVGAAVGTVFAEASVCFVQAYAVRKELPVLGYVRSNLFFPLLGGVMYLIVAWVGQVLGNGIGALVTQVFTGIVIYCAGCLWYFIKNQNPFVTDILGKILSRIKHS